MKACIAIVAILLVAFLGLLVYSAASALITAEYKSVLQYALLSADASGDVIYIAPDGAECAVNAQGIRKIFYYATYQPLLAVITEGDETKEHISVRIGTDTLRFMHGDKPDTSAVVYFDMPSIGRSYRVIMHKDNYWNSLNNVFRDKN